MVCLFGEDEVGGCEVRHCRILSLLLCSIGEGGWGLRTEVFETVLGRNFSEGFGASEERLESCCYSRMTLEG